MSQSLSRILFHLLFSTKNRGRYRVAFDKNYVWDRFANAWSFRACWCGDVRLHHDYRGPSGRQIWMLAMTPSPLGWAKELRAVGAEHQAQRAVIP